MYSAGQSLEHVSGIAERVDRETKAHYHHEQANYGERYLCPRIIWKQQVRHDHLFRKCIIDLSSL